METCLHPLQHREGQQAKGKNLRREKDNSGPDSALFLVTVKLMEAAKQSQENSFSLPLLNRIWLFGGHWKALVHIVSRSPVLPLCPSQHSTPQSASLYRKNPTGGEWGIYLKNGDKLVSILLRERTITNSTHGRTRFCLLYACECICTNNGLAPRGGMIGNSIRFGALELDG